jgi:aldehyde dehydrogenase (NAD+)
MVPWRRHRRTADDVDAAYQAARQAFAGWSTRPAHERARYLYAIARAVQKHARLFSVLESLDNGKPIRESRDIDIPLVARHFYYHAGWAELMPVEMAGYKPLGVVGQIIPWNFPAAHAGLEDRAGAGHGQHRRAQAGARYAV